jgi:signal transduction histidine kinase
LYGTYAPDFSRLSLKDALFDLCDKFIERSGIECTVSIDNELDFTPLSAENQLHLYRIVQEAFANIEKHSKTVKAVLVARRNLHDSRKSILICVCDDGIGLQGNLGLQSKPGQLVSTGLGMRSMRQRASILGADLDFINETGNGLMVRIEIPQ